MAEGRGAPSCTGRSSPECADRGLHLGVHARKAGGKGLGLAAACAALPDTPTSQAGSTSPQSARVSLAFGSRRSSTADFAKTAGSFATRQPGATCYFSTPGWPVGMAIRSQILTSLLPVRELMTFGESWDALTPWAPACCRASPTGTRTKGDCLHQHHHLTIPVPVDQ